MLLWLDRKRFFALCSLIVCSALALPTNVYAFEWKNPKVEFGKYWNCGYLTAGVIPDSVYQICKKCLDSNGTFYIRGPDGVGLSEDQMNQTEGRCEGGATENSESSQPVETPQPAVAAPLPTTPASPPASPQPAPSINSENLSKSSPADQLGHPKIDTSKSYFTFRVCNNGKDGDAWAAFFLADHPGDKYFVVTGWWSVRQGECKDIISRNFGDYNSQYINFYIESKRSNYPNKKRDTRVKLCISMKKYAREESGSYNCADGELLKPFSERKVTKSESVKTTYTFNYIPSDLPVDETCLAVEQTKTVSGMIGECNKFDGSIGHWTFTSVHSTMAQGCPKHFEFKYYSPDTNTNDSASTPFKIQVCGDTPRRIHVVNKASK